MDKLEGRSYSVHRRDAARTIAAGYPDLVRVPFILDRSMRYHRLSNSYLIDRALGKWEPKSRAPSLASPPTDIHLRNLAYWLANCLEYLERRGIDILECEYQTHLIERYQTEMLAGTWAQRKSTLSENTCNPRVDAACDFINWLSDKGHRQKFEYPVIQKQVDTSSSMDFGSVRRTEVSSRAGKLTPEPPSLPIMPTADEVWKWLERVEKKFGYSSRLICETTVSIATRREETVCLRTNTFPDFILPKDIINPDMPIQAQCLAATIKYGAKGKQYGFDNGDKVGPAGRVNVPLELAAKIVDYKNRVRSEIVSQWIDSGDTAAIRRQRRDNPPVHLFIDERTLQRIDARQFYRVWTGVDLPVAGWCPRHGRHYWACSTLLTELRRSAELAKLGERLAETNLKLSATDIIALYITPQLRHADSSTSQIYLRWILNRYARSFNIRYEASLGESQRTVRASNWLSEDFDAPEAG